MKKRVVITGIGTVSALGNTNIEFFNNLVNKKCKLLKVPGSYESNYIFKSKYYVPKPEVSIEDIDYSKRLKPFMNDMVKMTLYSTGEAIKDAGMIENDYKYSDIIIGVGMPYLQTAFDSVSERFHRMVIPISMPNSISAWISIIFGIEGSNNTINASCASGSYAIGEAYNRIVNGRCNIVIAGGSEFLAEKNGLIMRGFDTLGVLTKAEDGIPRPFSEERSGFLFNEGASCILILEELERAKNRKANIYAEIIDFKANSDAHNIVEIEPEGTKIKKLFNGILDNNIKIDYINAHGTGTTLNDRVEKDLIIDVFGDKDCQPIINSTKGLLGHSLGASGAFETAITAMSIKNSKIHGNLVEKPFDNLNVNIETINKNVEFAASFQYGFGGHNSMILLKKFRK